MAIPEVCALWIEQRVEEELESGKKSLRAIGREIAKEIEKKFEVKMKPETIRKKAERISGTNVPPHPTPEDDTEIPKNKEISKGLTMDGKARQRAPGAGRPLKAVSRKKIDNDFGTRPQGDVSDAMSFSWMAISQLKRIREDDPKREEAFDEVIEWINKNRRQRG